MSIKPTGDTSEYEVEFGHHQGTLTLETWGDSQDRAIFNATLMLIKLVKNPEDFSVNGCKLINK